MTRASIPTLLSLDRFAQIMSINPVHFSGAAGATIFPVGGSCKDIWRQYSWQSPQIVSREDIAQAIANAEEELSNLLGYYPAPVWIEEEVHRYTKHYRKGVISSGININGQNVGVTLDKGRLISPGVRNTTLLGTATVAGGDLVFSDEDGDGYNETVTITFPTALTDRNEIKVYYPNENGEQEWEIRPARSKRITGGNVIITFWAWQLIDPAIQEVFPTTNDGESPDIMDTIYLASVDLYREFTDFTQASAVFYWEPSTPGLTPFDCPSCGGAGCAICSLRTQDGCFHIRDVMAGIGVPAPGSYNSETGQWDTATWSECRAPDLVKLYYYAGDQDRRYLNNKSTDPLSHYWAETITWIAVARLRNPFASCGPPENWVSELQFDTARSGENEPDFTLEPGDAGNPLGTRVGEVRAWRRVRQASRRLEVAVI